MRLTECFMEIFVYIVYFKKSVAKLQPPLEQVRTDISGLMQKSEAKSKAGNFSQEDYDLARFAVCAWVDETIMNSAWNEKNMWLAEQLQRLYYQTSDAGELFFEKLNTIGPHQNPVREVYFLCLSLGFAGRFCHEGDEVLLSQLQASNLKLLTGSAMGMHALDREQLFPDAYPMEGVEAAPLPSTPRFSLFTLICVAGPVALFAGLYIIYYFVLSSLGKTILSTVR